MKVFNLILLFTILFATDSEYIKEHKKDLVKWYLWNKDSFLKAKRENKLIFVTIGYSTCHWCHVMMKESFRNKEVADLLNKHYIPIVVDKEESPEIDRFYQNFYKSIYNHYAGWPLNIIMTPNRKVLYISGYIPPNDFFAKKGIITILKEYLSPHPPLIAKKIIEKNLDFKALKKEIIKNFDFIYGGFKGLHKFPEYNKLKLLLDIYLLTKDKTFLEMFTLTLTNMAKSGMYDQIEGGFFRYTVYDDFSIPHFEKMLYSNALMIEIYSLAYKYTKKSLYKKVVKETIKEFYNRYFDKKLKLFYSSNSADSPNEGDYFCFSKNEIFKALKNIPNKNEILKYINFEAEGNFEKDKNHIFFELNESSPKNLNTFLKNLREIRKKHLFPFMNKKKILSWNAMMANSLFFASIIDKEYKIKAVELLDSILKNFKKGNIFYHSFVNQKIKKANLEDYAYLLRALITAYQFTKNSKYLKEANKIDIFKFKKERWYLSNEFPATLSEKSYPSGISVALNSLIDLSVIKEDLNLFEKVKNELANYPLNFDYAYLAQAKLKIKFKEYIIKSRKIKINSPIMYPFVLWKKNQYNYYQICIIYACLKRSDNFKEIENFFKNIKY